MLKQCGTEELMAAASRIALAPQHIAGFKARHLEGPKALALRLKETHLKPKLPKLSATKEPVQRREIITLWERAAKENFEPEVQMQT